MPTFPSRTYSSLVGSSRLRRTLGKFSTSCPRSTTMIDSILQRVLTRKRWRLQFLRAFILTSLLRLYRRVLDDEHVISVPCSRWLYIGPWTASLLQSPQSSGDLIGPPSLRLSDPSNALHYHPGKFDDRHTVCSSPRRYENLPTSQSTPTNSFSEILTTSRFSRMTRRSGPRRA